MKKYTMQDFIDGKVIVHTGCDWKPLLELCEKHNLHWAEGKRAIEITSFPYGKNLFIGCNYYNDKRLTYNNGSNNHAPVIEIGQFLQMVKKEKPRYQITIDCDGDTTTARMIINGKEVKTAKATRNPDDKFNWKLGAQLAFERLWGEKKPKNAKNYPALFSSLYIEQEKALKKLFK